MGELSAGGKATVERRHSGRGDYGQGGFTGALQGLQDKRNECSFSSATTLAKQNVASLLVFGGKEKTAELKSGTANVKCLKGIILAPPKDSGRLCLRRSVPILGEVKKHSQHSKIKSFSFQTQVSPSFPAPNL